MKIYSYLGLLSLMLSSQVFANNQSTASVNGGLASNSTMDLALGSGLVVKFVLLILILSSVISWAVIFLKYKTIKGAKAQTQAFLNVFWYGQDLEEIFHKSEQFSKSPVAHLFRAGYKELKKISQLENKNDIIKHEGLSNISRALNRTTLTEVEQLEVNVGILGTIASASPFIGLFGTVWGIMNSFQNIGATGAANLAVVAPGVSEALIATAFGLGAAIPAVMAYNHFVGKIKGLAIEMDAFTNDFLNIVQRSFMKVQ